jgi:hypothetical protein
MASRALPKETDTFKLAIKGPVALERMIDDGIRRALPGGAAKEIMGLRFGLKLHLAQSLGLITPETRELIARLNEIRNKLAHGEIDEINLRQARQLIAPTRAVFASRGPLEADTALDTATPHQILQGALLAAIVATQASLAIAEHERERRAKALEAAVRTTANRSAFAEAMGRLAEVEDRKSE